MVDLMDMALDDIIKANKKGRSGSAGRIFGNNRPGRGGDGGRDGFLNGRGGSGIMRGRNRGGTCKPSNYTRGDVNSMWKHNKFNDSGDRLQSGAANTSMGPTKLVISNLDSGVSDTDIKELFSEFGILKNSAVHYDKSGRSLRTADVLFERRADALRAMKQYNGLPLDGLPLNIQLATSEISSISNENRGPFGVCSVGPPRRNSNRGNTQSRRGGGGAVRGAYHGRRSEAGRGKRPVLTVEQLDAELDAYVRGVKFSKSNCLLQE